MDETDVEEIDSDLDPLKKIRGFHTEKDSKKNSDKKKIDKKKK